MAKRRSCRRTMQEDAFHDRAVKLRKMTDEQLCRHIDAETESAYKKGQQEGQANEGELEKQVLKFITTLQLSKIPGIGVVTINKLLKVAEENGYIQ